MVSHNAYFSRGAGWVGGGGFFHTVFYTLLVQFEMWGVGAVLENSTVDTSLSGPEEVDIFPSWVCSATWALHIFFLHTQLMMKDTWGRAVFQHSSRLHKDANWEVQDSGKLFHMQTARVISIAHIYCYIMGYNALRSNQSNNHHWGKCGLDFIFLKCQSQRVNLSFYYRVIFSLEKQSPGHETSSRVVDGTSCCWPKD